MCKYLSKPDQWLKRDSHSYVQNQVLPSLCVTVNDVEKLQLIGQKICLPLYMNYTKFIWLSEIQFSSTVCLGITIQGGICQLGIRRTVKVLGILNLKHCWKACSYFHSVSQLSLFVINYYHSFVDLEITFPNQLLILTCYCPRSSIQDNQGCLADQFW